MSPRELQELAECIAETFCLDKKEVEDCIHDYYSEIATEAAQSKYDVREIDEQEDLTNCQM